MAGCETSVFRNPFHVEYFAIDELCGFQFALLRFADPKLLASRCGGDLVEVAGALRIALAEELRLEFILFSFSSLLAACADVVFVRAHEVLLQDFGHGLGDEGVKRSELRVDERGTGVCFQPGGQIWTDEGLRFVSLVLYLLGLLLCRCGFGNLIFCLAGCVAFLSGDPEALSVLG